MTDTERLISEIGAFRARHDMSESTFGRLAVNDGHLMKRLGRGGITYEMGEKLRRFMANYRTTRATHQEAPPAQP
jgi:hypothetical protein